MEDTTSLDGSICTRCRNWDACTLPGFATIAGGHNFRQTVKDRYYNWYHHKFVRAYKEFGRAQCVACGRCQKYCPAGIDIEQVLSFRMENVYRPQKAKITKIETMSGNVPSSLRSNALSHSDLELWRLNDG